MVFTMLQIKRVFCENARRLCLRRHARLLLALIVGVGYLAHAGIASAAEVTASDVPMKVFPVVQVFTFLFLMLGPFKIIGPFSKITKGADAAVKRRIAVQATLFASLALLVAALLGERILESYGIPVPILALSAGLILFLNALLSILQQFAPTTPHSEESAEPPVTPTTAMALTPLAFPTIVPPYGIATLIVFLVLSPDLQGRLTIGAIVLVIMLLNLIVMIMTRKMLPVMGAVLTILGAVLGVVQVALGLQIIHKSLKALGAF